MMKKGFPKGKSKSKTRIRRKCPWKSVRFRIYKKLSDSDNIGIQIRTLPAQAIDTYLMACAGNV